MELTGRIIQILPESSGNSARGNWSRQDFIIETQEQFPRKVCVSNWNNKVDLNAMGVGTVVTASINIESREYNGKWYTDVRVWRMVVAGEGQPQQQDSFMPPPPVIPPIEQSEEDGLPF